MAQCGRSALGGITAQFPRHADNARSVACAEAHPEDGAAQNTGQTDRTLSLNGPSTTGRLDNRPATGLMNDNGPIWAADVDA